MIMATASPHWADLVPTSNRRTKARFPIELDVRYRSLGKRRRVEGSGRTLNMSSIGLLVAATHDVLPGERLKVSIDWPWLLDQVTRLQLIATGPVVRADASAFALRFDQYQFRTSGRRAPSDPAVMERWPLRA